MLAPYEPPRWRLQNWRSMPREEYLAYQGRVLSRFIKDQVYPYSKFYRRLFDDAGLTPNDINSVADLAKIPLTSKHDLLKSADNPDRPEDFVLTPPRMEDFNGMDPEKRAAMFAGMTFAERHEIERFLWEYHPVHANHTTGRSTSPTPVYFTRRDCYDYAETAGRGPIDPFGITLVLNPFTPVAHQAFWIFAIRQLAKGGRVIHTGGGKIAGTDGILDMVRQYKPTTLVIMPGYAFHFVRKAMEAKVDMSSVVTVTIGGEKCTEAMRKKLCEAFVSLGADRERFRVFDSYGATEFRGGYGECFMPTGDYSSPGFHTQPDMAIIEIVDSDTGEVLPEGETGEVVYTCLDWRGTVLLRYRTADIAVGGITTEPCPHCGATVPRISHELRRASNLKDLQLTKLKGNLVDMGKLVDSLRGIEDVEEYQIELRKQNDDPFGLDQLIVHVSMSESASEAAVCESIREETRKATEAEPNEITIHSSEEMLELVGAVTELKQKQIVDNRPKESTI